MAEADNETTTGHPFAPKGNTLPRKDDRPAPRLPHERDQSADQQDSESAQGTEKGRQAYADKQSGQQDTDKGPVLDKVYNDEVGRGAEGVAGGRRQP
ncbi:hypothetical protein [Xylophilus sp.]|uniref:hypothetical protein n=1 Tax=Xylophilus sp. TaxID=2653893 RepID=UPI0013B7426D|nr:hypothetical protein [Xylophilus sp.]KAF1043240.1 MAG: hypothetical protein GAK38_04039 [Xylophilus sp.]